MSELSAQSLELMEQAANDIVSKKIGEYLHSHATNEEYLKLVFSDSIKLYLTENPHVIHDITNGNITDEHIITAVKLVTDARITQDAINQSIDETLRSEFTFSSEDIKDSMTRHLSTLFNNPNDKEIVTNFVRDNITDIDIEERIKNEIEHEISCNLNEYTDVDESVRSAIDDQICNDIDRSYLRNEAEDKITERVEGILDEDEIERISKIEIIRKIEDDLDVTDLLSDVLNLLLREKLKDINIIDLLKSQMTMDNPEFAVIFEEQLKEIDWSSLVRPELNGLLSDNLEVIKKDNILRLSMPIRELVPITVHADPAKIESVINTLNSIDTIKKVDIGEKHAERQVG